MSEKYLKSYEKWNAIYGLAILTLTVSMVTGLFSVTYGSKQLGIVSLIIAGLAASSLIYLGYKKRAVRSRLKLSNIFRQIKEEEAA